MDAIIAAGTVPSLTALLRSDESAVEHAAAGALRTPAGGSQHAKDAIIAAGAVPLLLALMRSNEPVELEAATCIL